MATLQHVEVLGQGMNSSCSCCNTRSFNSTVWGRDQTCIFAGTQTVVVGFLTYCTTAETLQKTLNTIRIILVFEDQCTLMEKKNKKLFFFFFNLGKAMHKIKK